MSKKRKQTRVEMEYSDTELFVCNAVLTGIANQEPAIRRMEINHVHRLIGDMAVAQGREDICYIMAMNYHVILRMISGLIGRHCL